MVYRVEGDEIVFSTATSLNEALKVARRVAQNKGATFSVILREKEILFTSDGASSFYITLDEVLTDPKRVKKELKKELGSLVSKVVLERRVS